MHGAHLAVRIYPSAFGSPLLQGATRFRDSSTMSIYSLGMNVLLYHLIIIQFHIGEMTELYSVGVNEGYWDYVG